MILDETFPCVYNNYQFYYLSEQTEGGKKTVVHEYPNSDRRFVEELGTFPKAFTIKGVIYGTIQNRIDFEARLNEPGLHQLVHPFYGVVDNVMSGSWRCTANQEETGAFYYDLPFWVSSTDFEQVNIGIDTYTVTNDNVQCIDDVLNTIKAKYKKPKNINGYNAVAERITNIFSTIQSKISLISNPIQEKVADVNQVITVGLSGVHTLVSNAERMRNTFSSLYTNIINVVNTPADLTAFWNSLVDYQSVLGVPLSASLKRSTVDLADTADNIALLDEQLRIVALSSLHEAYAYKDMPTTNDIKEAKTILDGLFETAANDSIVEDTTTNSVYKNVDGIAPVLLKDQTIRNSVITLRNDTMTLLNNKLTNAWNVINERVGLTSVSVLSYQYYGDLENVDVLIGLNREQNLTGFKNNIDILGAR